MANKPLKSIKFPGLDDVYTVPQVDLSLSIEGAAADAKKTGDLLTSAALTDDAKLALLACFQKVAWIDDQGQTYYDALHDSLFPTAVSISATFAPGSNVFYETDTLDTLRPYLLVRATMPDSSVKVVTNYTLTGAMEVGTSTITVHYEGLTDVFTVTVEANPAYITAVFTQPQTVVYTDDALDSLKSSLIVTYYAFSGATGTVLSDTEYALIGTLIDGRSVITAEYNGLTDTFEVIAIDFYNQYNWNDLNITQGNASNAGNIGIGINLSAGALKNNRFAYTEKGLKPFEKTSDHTLTTYYPIPVPYEATGMTCNISPTERYLACYLVKYNRDTGLYTTVQPAAWTQGPVTYSFNADSDQFLVVSSKYDASTSEYIGTPVISVQFSK